LDFGKNFGKYGQFYEEFLMGRRIEASTASGISTFSSGPTSTA
jgi:hypothetical protein